LVKSQAESLTFSVAWYERLIADRLMMVESMLLQIVTDIYISEKHRPAK
jgi:hypothetical protein